ncbi:MAG: hypothetical protein JWO06_2999 [Bacteroidota bacterium]|nr:hypothetical protein [Bacteroidota bacterium]
MSYTPLLLMVEDDADDIIFLQEALNDTGVAVHLETVIQGDIVFPYLEKSVKLPDLIVLDLNLPKVGGKEILQQLKSTPIYKDINVIILTTSSSQVESDYCLSLGAKKFITKPTTIEGYRKVVNDILGIVINHR